MSAGVDHKKNYINVWVALLILTVITVAAAYLNMGSPWNILVAMLIGTIKAALVCLYFMELRYDNLTNRVVFVS